jgi:hypothetical protein
MKGATACRRHGIDLHLWCILDANDTKTFFIDIINFGPLPIIFFVPGMQQR